MVHGVDYAAGMPHGINWPEDFNRWTGVFTKWHQNFFYIMQGYETPKGSDPFSAGSFFLYLEKSPFLMTIVIASLL
jgi:hypothetical protein